jgi:hypothetical protein
VVAFPNPTRGRLNVSFDTYHAEIELTLSNMLGQTLFQKKYQETNSVEIEITTSAGIYLLDIKTKDGASKTLRIVKQ